ncbi:hypothetical protein EON80_29130 [bacterium]|nr:MAG: hypothetical protein EON80_29130 [bacterium]
MGETISGLAASAIPISAHFFPDWGEAIDGDLWLIPVWGLAAAAAFRLLFSSPFELWKEEKERADRGASVISEIGAGRPLRFTMLEFRFDYSNGPTGPLTEIRFSHENVGIHLVSYCLEDFTIEIDGQIQTTTPPPQTVFQQPATRGHFDCRLSSPITIPSFPSTVKVGFSYSYDTVPPTKVRRTGGVLRYVLCGPQLGDPVEGFWYESQIEE